MGHPSKTPFNIRSHEISYFLNICFGYPIILKLYTKHSNDTSMSCAKFQTSWLTAKYVIGKWDIMRIGSKVRFWPREICTLYCTLLWYVLVQIGLFWVIHFTGTDAIVRYISAYNMEFSLTHNMFTTYCCLLFEDVYQYIHMTHKFWSN